MNLKGKLSTNLSLTGKQAVAGGSGGSGGPTTWDNVSNKPFSTVDTAGGLTIYDNTLGIDTLDTIATIDYVDQQIASIPTPDIGWSDVQNKPFNTVGEGLEINNGSLKEAVPLYEETSSEEQTSTAEGYPYRQETSHYTDTFIWYEDRRLPMIPDATSIPQFEFGYEYDDGGSPTWASYSSSSLTPSDFLNGFSATDSSGNQWTISLHDYQLRFEKGSNVETYELSVSIEIYVDGEGNYNVSGTALRESWSEYTDSFIYPDDRLISMLIGASNVIMEFTYWDGSQDQTLYVNHLDLTDTSSDYEQDGLHWNIYAEDWSIYFNCTNGLPANAGTSATVQFTYTHTVETTTVHKLPAKYVPIDNNTIQVDWNGNLYANVPPSGVQSVSYSNILGEGTTVGYLNVDYNSYEILAPAGGTSTVGWDDIQNKPTFATVATSGSYNDLSNKPTIPTVPTNVSDFNNDAGYITDSALDGYATEQYVDDAIADIPAPTVEIDNKSIIKNQDDELQEAVPVYSAYESHTYNCFNNWGTLTTYNGEDTSDCAQYIYTTTHANPSKEWKFIINYDYDGNTYQMEGHVNSNTINSMWNQNINIDSNSGPLGSSFRALAVITQGSGSSQLWGCRLQLNGTFPSAINFIVFPEVPYDNTYTASTNVTEETVYKLPTKYTNVKFDSIYSGSYYPILYEDSTNTIRGVRIGAGTNMSISKSNIWGDSDSQLLTINCNLKPSPIGGLLPTNQGSYGIGTSDVTIDSTHFKLQLLSWSNFYNSWGSGNYYLTFNYCTGNYGDQTYSITGEINCGATVDAVTLDGFETIVDSVSYDSGTNRLEIYFKENYKHNGSVYIYKTGNPAREIQRVNSYWIPLDNSTIVRDSDGNIKTAIPAPPTTDGTYTLQVVVSNGEPTYSWI